MRRTIRILHALARSGGTVISRCLGCMDGVALLSEIHPTLGGEFNDPVRQAREWYGVDVSPLGTFADVIGKLEYAFRERGKSLVLRSWDHVDFVPCSHNRGKVLPMRSTLADELRKRFDLLQVVLFRYSVGKHCESLEKIFEPATRDAVRRGTDWLFSCAPCGCVISYDEDFCRRPDESMEEICGKLSLPFDAKWRDKWQAYTNVTGDIENQRERRTIP